MPVRHALESYCTKDFRELSQEVDHLIGDVDDRPAQVCAVYYYSFKQSPAMVDPHSRELAPSIKWNDHFFPQHLEEQHNDQRKDMLCFHHCQFGDSTRECNYPCDWLVIGQTGSQH